VSTVKNGDIQYQKGISVSPEYLLGAFMENRMLKMHVYWDIVVCFDEGVVIQ
jgi:hypothetical protein